jgi:hypothetical protein
MGPLRQQLNTLFLRGAGGDKSLEDQRKRCKKEKSLKSSTLFWYNMKSTKESSTTTTTDNITTNKQELMWPFPSHFG